MKLYRNLFYVLLGIFAVGVTLLCLVQPDSIISRISTGLVTGSFVGAVNVFVNYAHARSSYFKELAVALSEICHELGGDLIRARLRNNDLSESTKEEIIAQYKNGQKSVMEDVSSMEHRYSKLAAKVDDYAFSGIVFSDMKVKKLLREMESFIDTDVKYLYGALQFCLNFSLLDVKAPKAEQLLVIGEPDEFFEHLIESNKKFQGHLESDLKRMAELCASLSRLLRISTSSATRKILDEIPSLSYAFLDESKSDLTCGERI